MCFKFFTENSEVKSHHLRTLEIIMSNMIEMNFNKTIILEILIICVANLILLFALKYLFLLWNCIKYDFNMLFDKKF